MYLHHQETHHEHPILKLVYFKRLLIQIGLIESLDFLHLRNLTKYWDSQTVSVDISLINPNKNENTNNNSLDENNSQICMLHKVLPKVDMD